MKVNFAEVKRIPIASVLAYYNVTVRKQSDTNLVANCPFPSHEKSTHRKETLSISLEYNRWKCWSDTCRAASNKPKGGDVVDLVCMLENLVPLDAAKKLAELFSIGNGHPLPPSKPVFETNRPLAFELKGIDPEHPYIEERGISAHVASKFGVGFFPGKGSMANRIVFPLHENGALIGYAGRTVLGISDSNPKWKMPAGLVKSFVYGLERCDDSQVVILVESPWTVLRLFEEGYFAASLLGRTMTEAQEKCLAPFATICVEMDDDEPGREANNIIAARLEPNHKVYKALWYG